jgi:hydroxyethylthiazole kinase
LTGAEDIVLNDGEVFFVRNGDIFMTRVVGTGCMAASVIGAFAAVEKNHVYASVAALSCFEIAAECAAPLAKGPATFKEKLFDCLYSLSRETVDRKQKIYR